MHKHTPGPWIVGAANQGPVAGTVPIHTADYMESYRSGQLVCSVYGTASFSEANARLIAAAPTLLDALRALLQATEERETAPGFASAGNYARALDQARATIAKATGE